MPTPFDNAALFGVGSCGCNQTVHSPYALPGGDEPLVFLDFVNEQYVSEGSPVALNTLATEDEGNWGNFDPADIQNGVGYAPVGAEGNIKIIGTASDLIQQGGTVVLEATPVSAVYIYDDEFLTFCELQLHTAEGQNRFIVHESAAVATDVVSAGNHKIAFTFRTDGTGAISIDGAPIEVATGTPWGTPLLEHIIFYCNDGAIMRYIGFYPEQDDADLPMLSS